MKKVIVVLLLSVGYISALIAGEIDTLTLEAYLDLIAANHPLIKKAELFDDFVEAYALKGKGVLDPKLNSSYERKTFDGTNYFSVWNTEAKLPTRLPIDFAAGYDRNSGVFLSAADNVPQVGLPYATINLNLLRGLLFDEQRHAIQSAELSGIKSTIDQQMLVREILYQAISTYVEWAAISDENTVITDFLDAIRQRHLGVVDLYRNGDKPAVDTIESILTINTAEKLSLSANQKLIEKQQKLMLFLWNEDGYPLMMTQSPAPESLTTLALKLDDIARLDQVIPENDPKIQKIANQIEQLELDNRLQREYLKPQLELKYNTLVNIGKTNYDPAWSANDYKYGVKVEIPLRNRKVRGDLMLNNAITEQANYVADQQIAELQNKYESLILQRDIQSQVLAVTNEKIRNSTALYNAEVLKFDLGESSVFLLNQREQKLLQAQLELIKEYKALGGLLGDLYYIKLGQE